jgi:pimeloyl-ACP methyl ester carboxylesterase
MSGVIEAMRAVGVRPNEPVLLVGHSEGGLIAAELAADPDVRREFKVTHVITTGAPVASIRIPNDVQVLSIEHTDDLVPALDGSTNRDRPNWVTVSTSAPIALLPTEQARSEPLIAHRAELYQFTAARLDSSDNPSITAWRAGVAPFLGGSPPDGSVRPQRPNTAWDVELSRVGTS